MVRRTFLVVVAVVTLGVAAACTKIGVPNYAVACNATKGYTGPERCGTFNVYKQGKLWATFIPAPYWEWGYYKSQYANGVTVSAFVPTNP